MGFFLVANPITIRIKPIPMRQPVRTTLVENIARLMAERGLSTADVTRLMGHAGTRLYDVLNGKSQNPRADTIQAIADALGVPTVALLGNLTEGEEDKAFYSLYLSLPEAERRRLRAIGRAVASEASTDTTR